MENHLEAIARSYDKGIDLGRKGIDMYQNLPSYITNSPNYPLYLKMREEERLSDSDRLEVFTYLSPETSMNLIDLGCCLNLMFGGYRDWKSTYYGVDISSKTIELLHEFVEKEKITIGSLYCGSMHSTPYEADFFDICTCIGSLEYFEKDFVEQVIIEMHRLVKPCGKAVLDIPHVGSAEFEITMQIEACLGRPDRFNMSVEEFESLLKTYFEVNIKEKVGPMIQYFLVCRK